jgi:hypothetical protein
MNRLLFSGSYGGGCHGNRGKMDLLAGAALAAGRRYSATERRRRPSSRSMASASASLPCSRLQTREAGSVWGSGGAYLMRGGGADVQHTVLRPETPPAGQGAPDAN